jgi:hypothetical protein
MGGETYMLIGYGFIYDKLLSICEDCQEYAGLIDNNFHKEAEEFGNPGCCETKLHNYFDIDFNWISEEPKWLELTKSYMDENYTYTVCNKIIWGELKLKTFIDYKNQNENEEKELIIKINELANKLNVKAEWFVRYVENE